MDPGALVDSRSFSGPDVPALWRTTFTILNRLQPVLKLVNPTMQRSSGAAQDLINLSLDPEWAGQDGHFEMRSKKDSSPASMDEHMQAAVWRKSLEWSKIAQNDTGLPIGNA